MLLSYLAGFFDGEGSVGVWVSDRAFRVNIAVVGVNRASIYLFHETFGGSIARRQGRKVNHRDFWHWQTHGTRARNVLVELIPYLRLKRPQAIEAIKVPIYERGVHRSASEKMEVALIAERIKAMKWATEPPDLPSVAVKEESEIIRSLWDDDLYVAGPAIASVA